MKGNKMQNLTPTKTIPKMLPVTPAEEKEVQDVVKAMQAFLNESKTGVARYEITLANGRMFTTNFKVFANARTTLIKQQERKA